MESENSHIPERPSYKEPEPPTPPKRNNNKWIYLGIIGLLLVTNGILFFQKRKTDKEVVTVTQMKEQVVADRDNLQQEYNASLARLDELTSQNTQLGNQIKDKDAELAKTKERIQQILNNKNATDKELKEAKNLIAGLNNKIDGYEKQISQLKSENVTLTTQRDSLNTSNKDLQTNNQSLQQKVDLGKILHASNIRVNGIELRKGGTKEKEISKAKRVDVLRILFDIDENRLTESGTHELDIRITNPSGTLLSNAALGSGSFTSPENGNRILYSIPKNISLQTGQPVKDVVVEWKQSADYEKGAYQVEIYNKGYLIGRGTSTLR